MSWNINLEAALLKSGLAALVLAGVVGAGGCGGQGTSPSPTKQARAFGGGAMSGEVISEENREALPMGGCTALLEDSPSLTPAGDRVVAELFAPSGVSLGRITDVHVNQYLRDPGADTSSLPEECR